MLEYGSSFMQQLAPASSGSETQNGGCITSCICHGCPWNDQLYDGKLAGQHLADWFYGKVSGKAAWHFDTSTPNGNGTFTYHQCKPYPNLTSSMGH